MDDGGRTVLHCAAAALAAIVGERKEWMKPMEAHPLEGPHHFDSLFVIVRFAHVEFLHECL